MTIRFLHAADVHLGFRQYGSEERYDDFFHAFELLVDEAVSQQVDFVLLAGDLFHKRVLDPHTLLGAAQLLTRLELAGIPVVAIEGNHERRHYHERFSWLDCLAGLGLLVVLETGYQDGRLLLHPWDAQEKVGAYIDLSTRGASEIVRVIGLQYCGASTARVVRDLAQALARCRTRDELADSRPAYTIVLLHAGLQGILDHYSGTLTRAELDELRPHVDYVALGHIHKPFTQDGWLFNPGSMEANSIDEADWPDRGFLSVQVGSLPDHRPKVTTHRTQQRRFVRLHWAVGDCPTPESLYERLTAYLASCASPDLRRQAPVVELRLTGALTFDRTSLDLARIRTMVEAALTPIVANIRDLTTTSDYEIRVGSTMTRPEVERHVLTELVDRDSRRRDASSEWVHLLLRLKALALASRDPGPIIGELRSFHEAHRAGGQVPSPEGTPC